MHVTRDKLSDTKVKLTITADQKIIDQVRQATLDRLGRSVKVPGFRPGKAPATLLEKQLDQSLYQSEFFGKYRQPPVCEAAQHEKLRPVTQPEISITKFVPFTTLEFTAEVEAIGTIALPDYKKIKVDSQVTAVTAKDVNQVVDNLLTAAPPSNRSSGPPKPTTKW